MKVKFYYEDDARNMVVNADIDFATLHKRIMSKLSPASSRLRIKFRDEDDEFVLMTDDDDLEIAKGYVGGDMSSRDSNQVDRLELWCF